MTTIVEQGRQSPPKTNNKIFLETFNDVFVRMLEYISKLNDVGVQKTIKKYIGMAKLARTTNTDAIIESFFVSVLPHKNEILERNEQYFLTIDLKEIVHEDYLEESSLFKNIWTSDNISSDEKDGVISFMTTLVKLTEKYY